MNESNETDAKLIEHLTNNYLNTIRFVDVIQFVRAKALSEIQAEISGMNDAEKSNLLQEIEKQIESQNKVEVKA
jgi:hypothetical protein